MLSSTVPSTRYNHTLVFCCWPIRSTLAMAWSSMAVLISGSQRKTCEACTRLSPDEFALAWRRKHSMPGSCLKRSVLSGLSIVVCEMRNVVKARERTSRNSLNWENIMAFAPGSTLQALLVHLFIFFVLTLTLLAKSDAGLLYPPWL
jgi:hypothetical protein